MKTVSFLLLAVIQLALPMTHEYSGLVLEFEAFSPSGFKVSVPDQSGIDRFEFHANINKPMKGLDGGQFYTTVLNKTGGRWVYKNDQTVLQAGDEISLWVIVVQDNVHNLYSEKLVVKDIVQIRSQNHSQDTPTQSATRYNNNTVILKPGPLCNLAFNLSKSVVQLTQEVEKYKEINDILKDIISKNDNLWKTLRFEGVLPAYDDAQYTAQVILQDKLGLNIPVVNATKENENSVRFQVVSLDDKILVIRAAKEKLEKIKSKIILQY